MSKLVKNFAEILNGLPAGAWVAISEKQHLAIAYGTDARSVLNEAREKGEPIPLMVRVPESDTALAA
jgi:hypothetical protein